ncbi:mucin-5AC [Xenopus laevis]|uniref:Mucin-5AC n=1 Tax=Xenopus laevis TaxID=8355 RepID=A0A8J1M666_XENLA|nr:mucin-5AC [Xenopus laevis]
MLNSQQNLFAQAGAKQGRVFLKVSSIADWGKGAANGCQRVGGLLHGRLVASYSGAVITFMCNKGYKLCGSSVIYCDGRTWNSTKPVCREYDMMSMKEKAQVTNEKLMVGVTSNLRNPTGHKSSTEQNIISQRKARNNTITSTALNPPTANHIIPKDRQDSSQLITISANNVDDSQTNHELVHRSKIKTLLYSLGTSLPTTSERASVNESHKVNGVESSAFPSTMNQIPAVSVSPRWSKQLSPVTTIATPSLASKDQFFGTDYDETNHYELMIKNKSNLFGYYAHTTRTFINSDTEPTSTTTPASATDTTQSLHSRFTSSNAASSNISYSNPTNKIMTVIPEIVANSSTLEQRESLGSTSSPLSYSSSNSSSINDKNLPGEGNFPTSRSAPVINTIQAQALSTTHFHSSAASSDGVMLKNNSNRFSQSLSSPYEAHTTRTFINSNTALTSTATPGSATETTQFLQSRNTSSDVSKILNDDRRQAKINAPSSNISYMHVLNKITITVIPDTSTLEKRKIPGSTRLPSSNITSSNSSSVKYKNPPGERKSPTSRSAPVITTAQSQALSPTHFHSSPVSGVSKMVYDDSYQTMINTTQSNISSMNFLNKITMTAIPKLTANTSTLKQRQILGSTSSPSLFYIGTSSSLIKDKNLVNEGNFSKSGFAPVLTTAQAQALSATLFHPSAVASDGLVLKTNSNIFDPSSSSSPPQYKGHTTRTLLVSDTELTSTATPDSAPKTTQSLHLRFTSPDVNRMVYDKSQAKKNASLPNSLYFHFLNKIILTEIKEITANTSTLEQRKHFGSTSSPSSYSGTSRSSIQYNNPGEGNFPTSGSAPVITTAQAQVLSATHFLSSAAPSDSLMLKNNSHVFGSSSLSSYEVHPTRTFINSNKALTTTATLGSATETTQSLQSRFTSSNLVNDRSQTKINATQSNNTYTHFSNNITLKAIIANTSTLVKKLGRTRFSSYSSTSLIKSNNLPDKDHFSTSDYAPVLTTAHTQPLSATHFHSPGASSDGLIQEQENQTSTRKSAATKSSNVGNLGVIILKPQLLERSYNSSAPRHNVVYKTTVMQKTLFEKTENVQTFRTETESKAPKVATTLAKAIHYLHSGSQRKYFRRRRYCTYPPVPTHGTFRFLTMTDPSPYQYQYYIQYLCYPGYTMSQGDVFSFCLDNGMWTGVTPVCEEPAPCSINNGGCSQICKSHGEGQTECGCKMGFRLLSDMKTCKDIDECSSEKRLCEHTCTNTFGSFQCGCWKGFTLTEGGRTCIPYT